MNVKISSNRLSQVVWLAYMLSVNSNTYGGPVSWLTHDITSPVFLYSPGRGDNISELYRTGSEACLEAMPSPYLVNGNTTVTYSNPRGAHDANYGYGCLYDVAWESDITPGYNQVIEGLFAQNYMYANKLCPANYSWDNIWNKQHCVRSIPPQDKTCPIMNPIFPGTGSKIQEELDFSSLKFEIPLKRLYFSRNLLGVQGVFGQNWFLLPLDKKLIFKQMGANSYVYAFRSPNMYYQYIDTGGSLAGEGSDPNTLLRLPESDLPAVYEYRDYKTGNVEQYDASGKILTITKRNGADIAVQYSVFDNSIPNSLPTGLPILVEDSLGDNFELLYNADLMVDKIIHSSSTEITYSYDDPNDPRLLTGVGYSGGTEKEYRYEDSIVSASSSDVDRDLLNNATLASVSYNQVIENVNKDNYVEKVLGSYSPRPLAAIIDENGNAHSEWKYDSEGYAIEALHGNISMGRLDLNNMWDVVDPRVTYINPLGKETIYHYIDIAGARKLARIEGVATSNCVGSIKEFTYDTVGFVISTTDKNGKVTNYTRDVHGFETSRIEAVGTPQERTISTDWDTVHKLPTKITEPGKETIFTYDAQGRLLSQSTNTLPPQ
ncbi:hypothetical protein [Aurantivibrio infirmus]